MTISDPSPRVLIFRREVLPASETFIRDQVDALKAFQTHVLGVERVEGIVPSSPVWTASSDRRFSRLQSARFDALGASRGQLMYLRSLNASLLHAHFATDGTAAFRLAERLSLPMIVTLHGYDVTEREEYLATGWRRICYRKRLLALQRGAAMFIAVSDFVRRSAEARGFPTERMVTHSIGVDVPRLSSFAQTERRPEVLFVGRLVEKKGCEFLIRAMSELQREFPEWKLRVLGDGPLRKPLEALCRQSLRNYEFMGMQSSCLVYEAMGRCGIFAVPSIVAASGDAEGLGMVFLEAQAMGTPVVSFRSGGVAEAVEHGGGGLLAAEKDWRGLAGYLADLMASPQMRSTMGMHGCERVKKCFDLQRQTALLEMYYAQVIDKFIG